MLLTLEKQNRTVEDLGYDLSAAIYSNLLIRIWTLSISYNNIS